MRYQWREFTEDMDKAPNWFTASRIIGFFFLLLPLLKRNIFSVAFIVFLLLVATDFIDGQLARRKNIVTWLGKGLDPAADKVLLIGTMFALGFFEIYPVLGALIVILEGALFIIGAIAFFSKNKKFTLGANSFGKAKVILETAVIFLLFIGKLDIFSTPSNIILLVFWAAAITALMSILEHLNLLKNVLPEGDTIS